MSTRPEREDHDCKLAEELLDHLEVASGAWGPPGSWIFRGQSADWPLIPSALRPDVELCYSAPRETTVRVPRVIEEFEALRAFMLVADREGIALPEDGHLFRTPHGWQAVLIPSLKRALRGDTGWPPEQLLSVVALAQHYGVPTRLLDWSEKPLVAAYFAARNAADRARTREADRIVVWALNQRYVLERWNVSEVRVLIVSAPRATNPNLRAQAGIFTLDTCSGQHSTSRPLDEVLVETARADREVRSWLIGHFPVVVRLTLPRSEAGRLLRLLYALGVDAATVFPGLDGVVRSLNEKRLYDIPWNHPWGSMSDSHGQAYLEAPAE